MDTFACGKDGPLHGATPVLNVGLAMAVLPKEDLHASAGRFRAKRAIGHRGDVRCRDRVTTTSAAPHARVSFLTDTARAPHGSDGPRPTLHTIGARHIEARRRIVKPLSDETITGRTRPVSCPNGRPGSSAVTRRHRWRAVSHATQQLQLQLVRSRRARLRSPSSDEGGGRTTDLVIHLKTERRTNSNENDRTEHSNGPSTRLITRRSNATRSRRPPWSPTEANNRQDCGTTEATPWSCARSPTRQRRGASGLP